MGVLRDGNADPVDRHIATAIWSPAPATVASVTAEQPTLPG